MQKISSNDFTSQQVFRTKAQIQFNCWHIKIEKLRDTKYTNHQEFDSLVKCLEVSQIVFCDDLFDLAYQTEDQWNNIKGDVEKKWNRLADAFTTFFNKYN